MKRLATSLVLVLALILGLMPGCSGGTALTIFHAGSLTIPFAQISEQFNKHYPDVEIRAESAGSSTSIRKVTELGREADVVASADYTLIPELMFPEYADWYITFACNRMVIAYTDSSQFGDEVNKDNWYEILQREGVKYGRADPDHDPCGYRTLMVWQLAEDYYGAPGLNDRLYGAPGDMMRPKSVDLIALLESGDLDYAFEYVSVAKQHKLNFIELPVEIDLSSEEFRDYYATAQVEIAGKKPGEILIKRGKPIIYGVTIPKNTTHPELAIAWVDFLLSADGMAIMAANGQLPITPSVTNDNNKLPEALKKHVTEAK